MHTDLAAIQWHNLPKSDQSALCDSEHFFCITEHISCFHKHSKQSPKLDIRASEAVSLIVTLTSRLSTMRASKRAKY